MTSQPTETERFRQGFALIEELDNRRPGDPESLLHGMRETAPRLRAAAIESFGEALGDRLLDRRTKVLLAITCLAGQPDTREALRFHIGAALKLGWTRDEIAEAISLTSLYAGFPAAIRAMKVLRDETVAHV